MMKKSLLVEVVDPDKRETKWATMAKHPIEEEFTAPYRDAGDDAPAQLESHLRGCWHAYVHHPRGFVAPSVALVQSAGFGKSRLVYELARRTEAASHDMRVLYTSLDVITAYSLTMPPFRRHLCPQRGEWIYNLVVVEHMLCRLFTLATANWDSVGEEWFEIITDRNSSDKILDLLVRTESRQQPLPEEIPQVGEKPCMTAETQRLLVFTVDGARVLFGKSEFHSDTNFHILERAFVDATRRIRARYGPFAGVMGLLVDEDPDIITASKYNAGDPIPMVFPPFILTQTMDVFYNQLLREMPGSLTRTERNQQLVLASEEVSRRSLASMGRPLWRCRLDALGFDKLVGLAVNKLLMGRRCFKEENQFGVGSVLCRVGLRPVSWSPLASRLVATSLAVLSYVDASQTQFVSSYSTEPLVAFSAAQIWYQNRRLGECPLGNLDQHLLPHFRTLLTENQIDASSGRHTIVARIVLLLVMDACGVVSFPPTRQNLGDFCSVQHFLKVLRGVNSKSEDPIELHDPELVRWLSEWQHWYIGFSHFVELSDDKARKGPSDDRLWAMLARRAACLVGERLLLPIFTRGDQDDSGQLLVSAIQVTVAAAGDDGDDAKFSPVSANQDAIRISMDLSKEQRFVRGFYRLRPSRHSAESISASSAISYGLEVQGLAAWNARAYHQNGSPIIVPVMSYNVAEELKKLLQDDPPPLPDAPAPELGTITFEPTIMKPLVAAHSLLDRSCQHEERSPPDQTIPKREHKRTRRSKP